MPARFHNLDGLNVRVLLDRPRAEYMLLSDFAYTSEVLDRTIAVPGGFITDWGSVPRLLEWMVSGEDAQLLPGSIVHDYLYRRAGKLPDGTVVSRKDADRVLVEAMSVMGARAWKRNAVSTAVRIGGRYAK